jgi:hypothetical protein
MIDLMSDLSFMNKRISLPEEMIKFSFYVEADISKRGI